MIAVTAGSTVAEAVVLLASIVAGGLLRVLVARLAGTDPRSRSVWLAETIVALGAAAVFGVAFGAALGPGEASATLLGPVLGAWLTTYVGASAAFGFLGGRGRDLSRPGLWAAVHAAAALCAGILGFVPGVLVAGAFG